MSPSHYRPARCEVNARTLQKPLAQGLHIAHQLPFVHVAGRMILDHHTAIDNDGMDATAIGVVDQRVDGIEKLDAGGENCPNLRRPGNLLRLVGFLLSPAEKRLRFVEESLRGVDNSLRPFPLGGVSSPIFYGP